MIRWQGYYCAGLGDRTLYRQCPGGRVTGLRAIVDELIVGIVKVKPIFSKCSIVIPICYVRDTKQRLLQGIVGKYMSGEWYRCGGESSCAYPSRARNLTIGESNAQ